MPTLGHHTRPRPGGRPTSDAGEADTTDCGRTQQRSNRPTRLRGGATWERINEPHAAHTAPEYLRPKRERAARDVLRSKTNQRERRLDAASNAAPRRSTHASSSGETKRSGPGEETHGQSKRLEGSLTRHTLCMWNIDTPIGCKRSELKTLKEVKPS